MSDHDDRSGTYALAQQVGARAFFAGVAVTVTPGTFERELRIEVDSDVDRRWHASVLFGIDYAWEQLTHDTPDLTPVSVRVTSVDWQPSDSTKMTVAFAAANALWEALRRKPKRMPTLDTSAGLFSFPN